MPDVNPDNKGRRAFNKRFAGREAFTANTKGYRTGRIFYRQILAHRVIWAIHYGVWPDGDIDHINQIRDDNRIENLRIASSQENRRNASRQKNNSSGVNGVYFDRRRGKWAARIMIDRKNEFLGYFSCIKDAGEARKAADKKYGFSENHGSYNKELED